MFRHSFVLFALLGMTSASWAVAETYFQERVHDFGATPRGPQLLHYFRFTNSGKDTLTISNVRVSCGCVTASAPVTQVKPGESSYITAQMDSRRFSGHKAVTIYVQFSAPRFEEISLQVQANGRDDFSMYPETMAFGGVRKGSEPKASVQVTLVGEPGWQVEEVTADSNYVKPTAKLIKRDGNEVTYEIAASLRPDLPVGKWYTDVWMKTNSAALNKVRIPITVDVNASVTVSPVALMLGDVKVGDAVEQNVLVKSDKPFKIKAVKGSDTQIKISGVNDDARAVHVLKITFTPNAQGNVSKAISIITDDGDESAVSIPVRATATKD